MAGTVPDKLRFRLDGGNVKGIQVTILYTTAGDHNVYINGIKQAPTAWDTSNNMPFPITMTCGSNRFKGGEDNFLEFWITPSCGDVEVRPGVYIPLMVRLDQEIDDFYQTGGITRFIDRVSSALGIHASRVKMVRVW